MVVCVSSSALPLTHRANRCVRWVPLNKFFSLFVDMLSGPRDAKFVDQINLGALGGATGSLSIEAGTLPRLGTLGSFGTGSQYPEHSQAKPVFLTPSFVCGFVC